MGRAVHVLVVLAVAVVGASVAQFDEGPVPPRFQVLGAIPLGPNPGAQRPRPSPIARVRRPQARQQAYLPTPSRAEATPPPPPPPTIPTTLPPRPVAEEVDEYDDLEDATPPQSPATQPPPSLRQQLRYRTGNDRPVQVQVATPVPISISDIPVHAPPQGRPQYRQQPIARPAFRPEQRPSLRPAPIPTELGSPVAIQVRPQNRRPQPLPVEDEEQPQVVARQQFRQQTRPAQVPVEPRQQEFVRPQQKQTPHYKNRERKPVAQVLHKYRNDNPDGSITWGYENDDGSFKEETIGVDCVVSGKYGYVDPDGQRREYSYSSGIPCDKNKEQEENDQGYIDYQNNAYVLPNGQSVPIQGASKNKARRPPANYGK